MKYNDIVKDNEWQPVVMKENKKLTESKKRKEEMLAMRNKGKTYKEIAEHFGVSKQYVQQTLCELTNRDEIERKCTVDIEKIVYEGIYDLFANDPQMTFTKLARITYKAKRVNSAQREKIGRLAYEAGETYLTIGQVRNICRYIGKPFEEVFKIKKMKGGAE